MIVAPAFVNHIVYANLHNHSVLLMDSANQSSSVAQSAGAGAQQASASPVAGVPAVRDAQPRFACPWPNCEHTYSTKKIMCQHFNRQHRMTLRSFELLSPAQIKSIGM